MPLAVCAITVLTYFQFPGHTWLQSDTQIYAPILEHGYDPSILSRDLIVQHPHVAFTLYDEFAVLMRRATGLGFREILTVEQVVCRALGVWGLYLLAVGFGLPRAAALFAAAIVSLGATIGGPSVLTIEYEPVPRGFAVPVLVFAMGMAVHQRFWAASVAGSVAFLLHPPTAYPFWVVFPLVAVTRHAARPLLAFPCAALILWIASRGQGGAEQVFFARLDAPLEQLQRMRASYNWISVWAGNWIPHYAALWAASVLAVRRLWPDMPPALRAFAIGLPVIGVASLPVSYLTLDVWKWALMPQFQPMRAVLFVTLMTQLLACAAGARAAIARRWWEAIPWFALAFLIPVNVRVAQIPELRRVAIIAVLAALAWLAVRFESRAAIAIVALAAFFAVPIIGRVRNYPALHNASLNELSGWARATTPKEAVFLFPDSAKDLEAGVFRAGALRAIYVDWKGGGQVNYSSALATEWWRRWQQAMTKRLTPDEYAAFGVDYVVVKSGRPIAGREALYRNDRFAVYSTRP
ncbi:MAG: DUF6798 domain-containing protein [Bryobacteraceae bacterium]